MRIVACTGIYTYDFLPHYFENRDIDVMADHFVEDIERGCQGTEIRAAFLKCAADAAGVTENVEKVHRAVARASLQTGAPIMAHSMPAVPTGPRQVEIFREEGVDPSRVQIAHCGDSDDVGYIESLLAQGVYVGLDRYGLEMYLPIDRRNATAAALLERGHAERIDHLPGLLRLDRLVPAGGSRGVREPGRDPQVVDDAGLRRGRAVAARAGGDGRRGVRHDLPREPAPVAGGRVARRPRAADERPRRGGARWTGIRGPDRHRPAAIARTASERPAGIARVVRCLAAPRGAVV